MGPSDYELVIVQRGPDVEREFVLQLMLTGRSFTLVRPYSQADVGEAEPGFTATARNQALRSGDASWVVFLENDGLPDDEWFGALEHDLVEAMGADRSVSIGDDDADSGRHRDVAYRRDALDVIGPFDENRAAEGQEDLLLELRCLETGLSMVRGSRRLPRRARRE